MKYSLLTAILSIALVCNAQTHSATNSATTHGKATNTHFAIDSSASLNGTWTMQTSADEKLPVAAPVITINVADKTFKGNTGCNNMSGTFTLGEDNGIVFGPDIIVTKKACPGYNEKGFITNFTQTNHYRITNGKLELMNNDTVVSTWVKQSNTSDSTNKT